MQPEALSGCISSAQAIVAAECSFGRSIISPPTDESVCHHVDSDRVAQVLL